MVDKGGVISAAPWKSPDKIHILPELPKGPSGKVQRLKLLDLVAKDLTKATKKGHPR